MCSKPSNVCATMLLSLIPGVLPGVEKSDIWQAAAAWHTMDMSLQRSKDSSCIWSASVVANLPGYETSGSLIRPLAYQRYGRKVGKKRCTAPTALPRLKV